MTVCPPLSIQGNIRDSVEIGQLPIHMNMFITDLLDNSAKVPVGLVDSVKVWSL